MSTGLDQLKKAANLKPIKRTITLSDGSEFEFYASPLTMAQRERANRDSKSDDINVFALHLLVNKAQDGNGTRLFGPGDIAQLKNDVRDEDLQTLMLAVLQNPDEEEDQDIDLKSTRKGS